jgi:hypothetical protein
LNGTGNKPAYVAEKTPMYAGHALVPHRARALLAPGGLALVFTYRQPVDAHISLYLMWHARTANIPRFLDWSRPQLVAWDAYAECAPRAAQQAGFLGAADFPISPRGAPLWVGVREIEEAVHRECWVPSKGGLGWVMDLLYWHNLPRWQRVLPDTPMLCLSHDDSVAAPDAAGARLLEFLRLPPSAASGGCNGSAALQGKGRASAADRLLALAKNDNEVWEAKRQLRLLSEFFQGQYEFAQAYCSQQLPTPASQGWPSHASLTTFPARPPAAVAAAAPPRPRPGVHVN